jgi:hypothetical protein
LGQEDLEALVAADEIACPPIPHERFNASKFVETSANLLIVRVPRLKVRSRVPPRGVDLAYTNSLDVHGAPPFIPRPGARKAKGARTVRSGRPFPGAAKVPAGYGAHPQRTCSRNFYTPGSLPSSTKVTSRAQ